MKDTRELTPVMVFSGSQWEAGMVKSLLEDAGIEVYLNDENRAANIPMIIDSGGFGVVKVIVSSSDLGLAALVIDEYKKNQKKVH